MNRFELDNVLARRLSAGLALACLCLVSLVAFSAQPDDRGAQPRKGAIENQRQSTQVSVEKAGKSTRIVVHKDLPPIEVNLQTKPTGRCEATLSLSYGQRNTIARVETLIDTADCASCSGNYSLVVAVRDANGERKTLKFDESWRRTDNQPLRFTKDYSIGANVDVVRVHAEGLHCICADAPSG